ncbi:energy transducer TonB family protein, partial [Paracoccus nototheniae]
PEPQRQQAAPADAPARQAPPAQRAGEGGQSQTTRPAGGGGGASAATQASAMSQWGAQIGSCISRRAAAPRGVRQGGRVILSLTIANGGTIQAVGLAGSSGQPQLDQAALTAAQRVGRCPGAPRELTDATYSFQLPIIINVR